MRGRCFAFAAILKHDPELLALAVDRFDGWSPGIASMCSGAHAWRRMVHFWAEALQELCGITFRPRCLWACDDNEAAARFSQQMGDTTVFTDARSLHRGRATDWVTNETLAVQPAEVLFA